jgi:hypothetical protein
LGLSVTNLLSGFLFAFRWGKAIGAMASKKEDFDHARIKLNEALKITVEPHQRSKISDELEKIAAVQQ